MRDVMQKSDEFRSLVYICKSIVYALVDSYQCFLCLYTISRSHYSYFAYLFRYQHNEHTSFSDSGTVND